MGEPGGPRDLGLGSDGVFTLEKPRHGIELTGFRALFMYF